MNYTLSTASTIAVVLIAIWDIIWKGFALWRASHHNQSGWFIALLVLNTAGILPIIYLLTHRVQTSTDKDETYYEKAVPLKE